MQHDDRVARSPCCIFSVEKLWKGKRPGKSLTPGKVVTKPLEVGEALTWQANNLGRNFLDDSVAKFGMNFFAPGFLVVYVFFLAFFVGTSFYKIVMYCTSTHDTTIAPSSSERRREDILERSQHEGRFISAMHTRRAPKEGVFSTEFLSDAVGEPTARRLAKSTPNIIASYENSNFCWSCGSGGGGWVGWSGGRGSDSGW